MSNTTESTMPFGVNEVLQRAIEILERGPLTGMWSEHGEWCPYCAIGLAKSELDEEHGTGLDPIDSAIFYYNGVESDRPLIEARKKLGTVDRPFKKHETMGRLSSAIVKEK
jgi:hypothetical protein